MAGVTGGDGHIAAIMRSKNIKLAIMPSKPAWTQGGGALGDFARLGLGAPTGRSALPGRNLDQDVERIRQDLNLVHAPSVGWCERRRWDRTVGGVRGGGWKASGSGW